MREDMRTVFARVAAEHQAEKAAMEQSRANPSKRRLHQRKEL